MYACVCVRVHVCRVKVKGAGVEAYEACYAQLGALVSTSNTSNTSNTGRGPLGPLEPVGQAQQGTTIRTTATTAATTAATAAAAVAEEEGRHRQCCERARCAVDEAAAALADASLGSAQRVLAVKAVAAFVAAGGVLAFTFFYLSF